MNVADILLRAGGAAVNAFLPGVGSEIVSLVNAFLPEDRKLPPNATGAQVQQAVSNLPPDKQAELLSKEMDVVLAEIGSWTQIQQALGAADGPGSSTRPKIAMMMAKIVCFESIVFIAAWAVAMYRGGDALRQIADSSMVLTALLGTPSALLYAYFGMRKDEKLGRYSAILGQAPTPPGISGWIQSFAKKK